jgi:hypothetical protein
VVEEHAYWCRVTHGFLPAIANVAELGKTRSARCTQVGVTPVVAITKGTPMTRTAQRSAPPLLALIAAVALVVASLSWGGGASVRADSATSMTSMSSSLPHNSSQAALYLDMRTLWDQHMEWTYATVSAFVAGSPALTPTLHRLLRNQADIGHAVRPFYGKAASHHLTTLLKTHINDAVPVLVAAQAGDTTALGTAVKAWYANAKRIADFLARANPHWHRAAMERMMHKHITQTIAYASDQVAGKYAASIADYGTAEAHMRKMADMLSRGLIKQFPHRFAS